MRQSSLFAAPPPARALRSAAPRQIAQGTLALALTLTLALALALLVPACSESTHPPDASSADRGGVLDQRASELALADHTASERAADRGRPDQPVGTPVPGCADPKDPTLTASEKLLLGLPADSWSSAPGSKLLDTCKSAASYGDGVYLVSGCGSIVAAWGGGALDTQRQKMVVWGGGHNDYGGNEVYAFDLKTFAWEQQTTPSKPPFNKDPLDDGKPVSRHTYDGVEFIAHRGTILGWGGSRSTDGGGTMLTWEYQPDSKSWSNLGAAAPAASSAYDFGLAYDPGSKRVLLHSHAYLGAYDFTSNQWKKLKDFGYPPYTGKYDPWKTRVGAVDPKRRLFVTLGGGSAVLVYDLDGDTVVSLAAPWSELVATAPFLAKPAPGLDYDEATQQLVAWAGGSPYVLDTGTTPYQWTARSAAGAPVAPVATGTYGRWRYAPRYNVFVLINGANDDVRFYKHTPGCGK